jgi:hypothetical protein
MESQFVAAIEYFYGYSEDRAEIAWKEFSTDARQSVVDTWKLISKKC